MPDREVWGEHQDPVTISWQKDGKGGKQRAPSVPLTVFPNQCLCECERDNPSILMLFSCKSMDFLFSRVKVPWDVAQANLEIVT